MKCPVCEKQIKNAIQKCPNCGFEDLRTEFINENELKMWQTYVVYPCKFAYQTSVSQIKELERKFKKELSEIKKIQKEVQESERLVGGEAPTFKRLTLRKSNGWNTSGPIAYKNFYECTSYITKSEINNIVINIIGSKAIINFFVKKTYDENGPDSTYFIAFNWKLKDDYGIVVADGHWSNSHLQVGDVTKDTISINGLDPSIKYTLELVND